MYAKPYEALTDRRSVLQVGNLSQPQSQRLVHSSSSSCSQKPPQGLRRSMQSYVLTNVDKCTAYCFLIRVRGRDSLGSPMHWPLLVSRRTSICDPSYILLFRLDTRHPAIATRQPSAACAARTKLSDLWQIILVTVKADKP